MLALPPHEEPNYLDLVGYGKAHDDMMIKFKKNTELLSSAINEIINTPNCKFRWVTIK